MSSSDSAQGITVYRPNQRHELGYFACWKVMLGNIVRSRELIWQLFKRDFFTMYKKSYAGVAWVFLSPLIGILAWVFLKHSGILRPGDVGVPYPVYVLVGTSVWGLFLGFYKSASDTLSSGSHLVLQVHYPHEVFLFEKSLLQLVNFVIVFFINIAVLFFFGLVPCWQIVFFPLVILPLFFLAAAIGLMVSMISVVALDIDLLMTAITGLLVWSAPIIYSDEIQSATLQSVNRWNPLTYLVCSARDLVIYGRLYDLTGYILSAIFSLTLFFICWRLFYVSEGELIERIH
jgi:lipopolysaccharide transport system permease protein